MKSDDILSNRYYLVHNSTTEIVFVTGSKFDAEYKVIRLPYRPHLKNAVLHYSYFICEVSSDHVKSCHSFDQFRQQYPEYFI